MLLPIFRGDRWHCGLGLGLRHYYYYYCYYYYYKYIYNAQISSEQKMCIAAITNCVFSCIGGWDTDVGLSVVSIAVPYQTTFSNHVE